MTKNYHPTIMGIDPGVSTGVALAVWDGEKYQYSTATCTEPDHVWSFVTPGVGVLIIERFAASLISKYGLHTVDIIGGVRALCWLHGATIIEDTPAQRKPYIEYARAQIPNVEGIPPHEQRHEVDALAHVIRHLYQTGYIKSLKV